MLVVGLWHGAGWQYVGFGVLMSGAILVSRAWGLLVPEDSSARRAVRFLGTPILWWFLFWNWILFRSSGWGPAKEMLSIFFFLDGGGMKRLDAIWLLAVVAFFAAHHAFHRRWFTRLRAVDDWTYAVTWGAAAALVLALTVADSHPFIYFQF